MRTSKHLIATASLIAAVGGISATTGTALAATPKATTVVLGKSIPGGKGWGTAAPRVISDASDPASRITQIHWQHWGAATATGWGMTALPKQTGGYYAGLYRVQLRATQAAWDAHQHAKAYMLLQAKEPLKPGAALSSWFQWIGQQEMCN